LVETSRKKLIGDRTPKDFGIRKGLKKRVFYYATCDRKIGKKPCRRKFSGWVVDLVMGNMAIHEQWHDELNRRAAAMVGVSN